MDTSRWPRRRIYQTLVAVAPLAVFYGLATAQEAALWLGVAAAALGNGLAARHAPRRRDQG